MPDEDRYQHYEVLKRADGSLWELGRGAMGITYKAYDTNLRCPVALKVINAAFLDSETARQRFLREARAAAALRHQNVASVFHLGTDHGNYFYAMEFIDGETVDEHMKRHGRLDAVEALELALQVTRALAAAARQHLVHRDLKPANLMLVDEDGEKVLKVIDFGLAKSVKREGEDSGALTVGGGFVGTPHFASPEQLEERDIDLRSDIYSLGATLYYLVTGRPPFSGSVAQIMSQHLYKPVPTEPLQGCPPVFADLILRMMKKDPGERPQSPAELRQEVQACLSRLREHKGPDRGVDPAGRTVVVPETLATLDLAPSGKVSVGEVFARQYRVDRTLPDHIAGQCFAGFDLYRQLPVNLLVLSRAFLADTNRYAQLKKAADQVRAAPHPGLRQVLALETVAEQAVLVEESVVGPSLRELLRIRGALTASEVVRILQRLAPVVDHARMNHLEHVDFSLSGIQLADFAPGRSEAEQTQRLQKHLSAWPELILRVTPIDFTLEAADVSSWAGAATLVQPSGSPAGPRGSYVRQLSLLAYELLGGPRTAMEVQGRYTPIAALPEEGNHLLRRGMVDEVTTAAELSAGLASAVPHRGAGSVSLPPVEVKPASTGAAVPAVSGGRSDFPAVSPPPLPIAGSVEPFMASAPTPVVPAAASSAGPVQERGRSSKTGRLLTRVIGAGVLAALAWGGYGVYQHFARLDRGEFKQTATPTPVVAPTPVATPTPRATLTPVATPTPRATLTPAATPTPMATLTPAATLTPRATLTPAATPRPVVTPTPVATPTPVVAPTPVATPTPVAAPTVQPSPTSLAEPTPEPTSHARARPTAVTEADVFEREIDEAQNASRTGDWQRALVSYVQLAEQFPNRTEPTQRLENLLAEVRNNPTRINPANFETAQPILKRAARVGVVQAMLILGQNLRSVRADDALAWYDSAAQKGNLEAMVQVGLIYSNRRNPEDGRKALEYFLQAADGGSREGKYYTGECFYFGKPGVLPDEPKSLQYLQEAAALGDLRAMNLLGDHLRKQSRYDQALRYFEEAAKGGLPMATANLGVMYMNGWGVSKNREAAVNLFRQAAEKSDAGGMFFLAECLQGGLGTPKDPEAALDWFKKAARAGNSKAIEYCRAKRIDLQ